MTPAKVSRALQLSNQQLWRDDRWLLGVSARTAKTGQRTRAEQLRTDAIPRTPVVGTCDFSDILFSIEANPY